MLPSTENKQLQKLDHVLPVAVLVSKPAVIQDTITQCDNLIIARQEDQDGTL